MKKRDPENDPLILGISHLIIYEITFALFVIYYIQQGTTWFKISFLAIAVAELTALIKILSGYSKWSAASGITKKAAAINLLVNLVAVAVYLFCLLVQAKQWKAPDSPPLINICLTAVPPFITFVLFLYSDARHSGTSKQ